MIGYHSKSYILCHSFVSDALCFNKHNICTFFNIVKETITKLNVSGAQIYNLDESGLNTVQKVPKLIAPRGVKQIGQVTSTERGELVTICCIVSAVGHIIPQVFLEFLLKSEKVAGKFVKPKVEDVASVPITCVKHSLLDLQSLEPLLGPKMAMSSKKVLQA
jgi:hypothetical protein